MPSLAVLVERDDLFMGARSDGPDPDRLRREARLLDRLDDVIGRLRSCVEEREDDLRRQGLWKDHEG